RLAQMARHAFRSVERQRMSSRALAEESEVLSADVLIDRVLAQDKGPACITCSFQAEDMIVLDLRGSRMPGIPVLFLDTGYHFAETYAYRDRMAELWNLNVRNLGAPRSVSEQEREFGLLNRTDPGVCCQLRKVEPLFGA